MTKPVDLAAVRASRARLRALAAAHPELCGEPGADNVSGWTQTLTEDEERMAKSEQLAIRMDEDLVARIDAHMEQMQALMPGVKMTRADAIRALILKALGPEEKPKRKGAR